MSGGVYGGDDVGALIFDFGSYSLRTGYAGEDVPKFEIPSYSAFINDEERKLSERKWMFGLNYLKVPKKHKELVPIMKEGLIDDWNLFEQTLKYVYENQMMVESTDHPLLMSEPPWNPRGKRENLTEILFEKFNIPAFYLVKNPVLSSFSNGKSTGLIIDSGATHTTITPVYDGYCLLNCIVKMPLGGDFLSLKCKNYLAEKGIPLTPYYMTKYKENTELINGITKSYHNFMVKEILQDFQASILQVNETPLETRELENMPLISYEFPNHVHKDFGIERFQIPENLFELSSNLKNQNLSNTQVLTISQAAATSVNLCDIDIRSTLYNSVMVVGGNTLIHGFTDRLNNDLSIKTPSNVRLKLHYSNNSAERRFSSWIGGSILASLGTFQQLWVSKQEYEEGGKHIIEKKCP